MTMLQQASRPMPMLVPGRTPSLLKDIAGMGLSWEDLGDGYWQVKGALFALYVLELGVVAKAEGDALLQSMSDGELLTEEARWFWMELVGTKEAKMSMQDMEGYQELMDKLLANLPAERVAKLVASLPPEQRLAGLPAEQRLAGLDRDHQVLALPLELLRQLSEAYLLSLPPEVQAEVRRRLAQTGD